MKIVIMDYTLGDVTIRDVPKELENFDEKDIFERMGYDPNWCLFMVVHKDLNINFDTKGCSGFLTVK